MCISGFSNLIFHLLRGRVSGENCHFRLRSTTSGTHFYVSFPSTVDNFRYTFRSPQHSFIASYDAKNELIIASYDAKNELKMIHILLSSLHVLRTAQVTLKFLRRKSHELKALKEGKCPILLLLSRL